MTDMAELIDREKTMQLLDRTLVVDGTTIAHFRGPSGSLITYLGEFRDVEELTRYVRARNGATDESGESSADPDDGSGYRAEVCNCKDPHGPDC